MAIFPDFKLTKKGEELLNRCVGEGKTLTFTKIKIGDGTPSSDWRELNDVENSFKEFPILETSVQKDQTLKIKAYFDNKDFLEDKKFREVGVFVKLDTLDGEFLYSYTNAGDTADTLPAKSKGFFSRTLDILNYIGYACNVTFNIENVRNDYDFNTESEIKVATFLKSGDRIRQWGRLVQGDIQVRNGVVTSETTSFNIDNGLFVKLTGEITVGTIDELKNLKGAAVGTIINVLGYYKKDDGANHKRIITDEDDGSGVQLTNELVANIIHNGEVNVSWFGVRKGSDNANLNTVLFQKSLDYNVGVLKIDLSFFLLKNPDHDYCVILTKNKNIISSNNRFSEIIGYSEGVYDILQLNITENYGYLDIRGFKLEGVKFWFANGGRYSVNQIGGLPMLNSIINNNAFGSGKSASPSYGFYTKECKFAHSVFSNNEISSLYFNKCLDANKFVYNTITEQKNKGIVLDLVFGCYNTLIAHNTITNRDGAIHIINGSQVKITNNQIESFQAYGKNQSLDNSHIFIEGKDYKGQLNVIENNNLGGGTNLKHLIKLDNTRGTIISKNRFNAPMNEDIVLGKESWFTRIMPDNISLGNISSPRNSIGYPYNINTLDSGYGTMGIVSENKFVPQGTWGTTKIYIDPATNKITFINGFSGGNTGTEKILGKLTDDVIPIENYRTGGTTVYAFVNGVSGYNIGFLKISKDGTCEIGANYANVNIGMGVEYITNTSDKKVVLKTLATEKYIKKMKTEGVYNDFISYMDEKTEYDNKKREQEKNLQEAYKVWLESNPDGTYEEFVNLIPNYNKLMLLPEGVENFNKEPQPSEKLLNFKEKYLG